MVLCVFMPLSSVGLALWQCGADASGTARVLLKSSKPSLHMNVDCTALIAAVVSRQAMVVRQILQVK